MDHIPIRIARKALSCLIMGGSMLKSRELL